MAQMDRDELDLVRYIVCRRGRDLPPPLTWLITSHVVVVGWLEATVAFGPQ